MKTLKKYLAVLFAGLLLTGMTGCQQEEGPAEKADKSMDEAMESIGTAIEDSEKAVKESAEKEQESISAAVDQMMNPNESEEEK